MKKTLTCILMLALVIACVCAISLQTTAVTSGIGYDNLTWTLDDAGTLTISGAGPMRDYLTTGMTPWDNYCKSIENIVIGDGVTTIGDYAFYGCTNLTSITIGKSVTTIGTYAISSCVKLTAVTIPDSVTTIRDHAFYNCTALTDVHIADIAAWCAIDFYDPTANPFYYGQNLYLNGELVTELVIPKEVAAIGEDAFCGCESLTSVIIEDGVGAIGDTAFSGCANLTSVTIPVSVSAFGAGAFRNCSQLTDVHITDLAAWCVNDFYDLSSNPLHQAQNLYLNGEPVTELVIPEGAVAIGKYLFCGYKNLTSVTIGDGVVEIGKGAFASCKNLTVVTIPDSVTTIGDSAFSSCSGLTAVTLGDSVQTIGEQAFYKCEKLERIVLPDSVVTIGESAFREASGLTSVTLGAGVTKVGEYAFYLCDSLTDVYITDPYGWCNIQFADEYANPRYYADCLHILDKAGNEVTELVLEGRLTSIPYGAFTKSTELVSVTVSGIETVGATAFYSCTNLTAVTIGDGVTTIGNSAFDSCTKLKSLTMGDGVVEIGAAAFNWCTQLTDVYYAGAQVQWDQISIGAKNEKLTGATIHYKHIHDYSLFPPVTVESTCEKNGYVEYTCTFGETHRVPLPKAKHNYPDNGTVVKPTCSEDGYTEVRCSGCGLAKIEDVVPALGHDYTIIKTVVEPTCTEEGYSEIACARCGGTEKQAVVSELGHQFEIIPAVAPTCTKPGLTAGTACERCQLVGVSQTEIPATGHSFADHICTVCGAPDSVPGELDGVEGVNEDDVIYLLQHLLMPGDFPVSQMVDYDRSGSVDEDDVIYLLQHLLMPEDFPLT